MDILIMVLQFIVGLTIIVGLHELGHMLFARFFGMRVEKFSIGFPPKIFSFKVGHTEYAIGAIPLGGSVKIAGMLDEYLDQKQLNEKPKPWEFSAKPAWQRWLVIMGGIIFNIISGVIIYIILTFSIGEQYVSKNEMNKHGIYPHELGKEIGFQKGDKIVNIGGKDFEKFDDTMNPYHFLNEGYYTVLRNGETITIQLPEKFVEKLAQKKQPFIEALCPYVVEKTAPGSTAEKIGLQNGDKVVSINGYPASYFQELTHLLMQFKGQKVQIIYENNQSLIEKEVIINANGKLGFYPKLLLSFQNKQYNLVDAVIIGTQRAFDVVWTNAIGLTKIFTGKISASQSLTGPIGIAKVFGTKFNAIHFWQIIGFLSMVLAFVNFLPIPALDGGHSLFLLYEMIVGRSLPTKFLIIVQKIGILLLLSLALYTIFNDVSKFF